MLFRSTPRSFPQYEQPFRHAEHADIQRTGSAANCSPSDRQTCIQAKCSGSDWNTTVPKSKKNPARKAKPSLCPQTGCLSTRLLAKSTNKGLRISFLLGKDSEASVLQFFRNSGFRQQRHGTAQFIFHSGNPQHL